MPDAAVSIDTIARRHLSLAAATLVVRVVLLLLAHQTELPWRQPATEAPGKCLPDVAPDLTRWDRSTAHSTFPAAQTFSAACWLAEAYQ